MEQVRTINSVFDEILSEDNRTAISKHAIRKAVLDGKIPSVKAGRTFLITKEAVIDYFTGGTSNALHGGRSDAALHKPLNNYISLDSPIRSGNEDSIRLIDTLIDASSEAYFYSSGLSNYRSHIFTSNVERLAIKICDSKNSEAGVVT